MVIHFDAIPVLHLPGRDLRVVLDPGKGTNTGVTAIITEIPAGAELPVHAHAIGEESMYFVSGMAETVCDGEAIVVKPGDTFTVPEGSVHTVRNVGQDVVRMFCVFSPAIDTAPFEKLAKKD